jgi:diketogulonate reductase-like aldo/keto reductase
MATLNQRKHAAQRREFLPTEGLGLESTISLRTGNQMPLLGLGSWMLTTHTVEAVQHALELGYRMIDTSADYLTQPGIGRALRRSSVPRDEIFVVMKVEEDENGYEATIKNLEELKLAYADLVLIHRPPEKGIGEDIWRGLLRARDEGLTRDIGVSSYNIPQMKQLGEICGELPAVNQIEWSPFGHSLDMLSFCRANDIVVQAYSPLTRGKRLGDARLVELARRYGRSPAQLILRWNLQHGVVPLPKAYREDHQRQNLDLFGFELDERAMAAMDAMNEHYSALEKLDYL